MEEIIQYVGETGELTGEQEEAVNAHDEHTQKHLGFSCYVFNGSGQLLVGKHSDSATIWPGKWSNTLHGHLQPGEDFEDALHRCAYDKYGMQIESIICIKRDYSYQSPAISGIAENEYCPIFIAVESSGIAVDTNEISEYAWMDFDDYIDELQSEAMGEWTWWAKNQIKYVKSNPQVIMAVLG